ncbi:odorant receptor 4-like isoform X1 [Vespula maculifrons]|uniref:Odorant receptor 4-like isoform X1 n=1 Tax=Vespula maculifrons TaxID=7453 RepID=A0ABD2BQ37_VESMC
MIFKLRITIVWRSFLWSPRFLKCMEICPMKNYLSLFLFFFTIFLLFVMIHCSLTFAFGSKNYGRHHIEFSREY